MNHNMINYNHNSEKNEHLLYMDFDSFVSSVIKKDIVKDLKNLDDLLEFNNLSENYELLSNENQKVIGRSKK